MTALCFSNPQDLKTLLQDVLIQHIRIDFENYSKESIQEFEDLVQERGLNPEDILGAFHGQEIKGNLPNYVYHTVFVDDIYQAIEEGQLSSQYVFTIGSDYFKEIAKMRAFFIAFETINKTIPFILAQTTLANKTTEQPYNNLLRTTTESMSAIFGGCDALMIRPYNQSFEEVTDFSNRLARNQHHILREESFLEKVQDPSAGSYYIEALTQSFLKSERQEGKVENIEQTLWHTAEQIAVKSKYTKEDIQDLEHIHFGAGIAPNLRGPYSSYVRQSPLDYSSVCWFFYGTRIQCLLQKKLSRWAKRLIGSF